MQTTPKVMELWPRNRASGRVCASFQSNTANKQHVNQTAKIQQLERTQKVFNAIKSTVDNSASTTFRAGDISQTLRNGGFPLGSWEVRGEFSNLESSKLIKLDTAAAEWALTDAGVSTDKLS